MMSKLSGLISAPLTGFHADGQVNLSVIKNYADFLTNNGVAGAFVNGTTGEGFSLTMTERKEIAETWIKSASDALKVIVHVAHTSIEDSKELAAHAEANQADAISSMAPIFFKPGNLDQLVDSMAEIAAAAPNTPFYYYHMPAMSGVNFPMIDFLKKAEDKIPTLAGIKFTYENLMDFEQCRAYKDGKFVMLHGRDETLICSLALGTEGAVGSTYNFIAPVYTQMITAFEAGNLAEARRLQRLSIKVIEIMCATGNFFSAAKAMMKRLGLDLGPVRSPLQNLGEAAISTLFAELDQAGFNEFCSK